MTLKYLDRKSHTLINTYIITWSSTLIEQTSRHSSIVWAKSTIHSGTYVRGCTTFIKSPRILVGDLNDIDTADTQNIYLNLSYLIVLREAIVIKNRKNQCFIESLAVGHLQEANYEPVCTYLVFAQLSTNDLTRL